MVKKKYDIKLLDKWGGVILRDIIIADNITSAKKRFLSNRIKIRQIK